MDRKQTFLSLPRGRLCLMAPAMAILCAGCSLDFLAGEFDEARVTAEITTTNSGAIGDDEVVIRFINRTGDDAVDVEFFATNDPLTKLPDELFVEGFRVTREIGLAGRGVLAPQQRDEITFPCTADLSIGTSGGEFTDADTGDERGLGDPRWAQDRPLGLCGTIVMFEFVLEGDTYKTRIELGD